MTNQSLFIDGGEGGGGKEKGKGDHWNTPERYG